jgi:hypothetical protein
LGPRLRISNIPFFPESGHVLVRRNPRKVADALAALWIRNSNLNFFIKRFPSLKLPSKAVKLNSQIMNAMQKLVIYFNCASNSQMDVDAKLGNVHVDYTMCCVNPN